MSGWNPIRDAFDAFEAARAAGDGRASFPVGDMVLCDIDSTDLTASDQSGGYLFGSYAVGPCCADRHLANVRRHGEERHIRARCPEGVSFADWVRGLRGPDAAITVRPMGQS